MDIMRCIPFGQLMDWILEEYNQFGTIFGVKKICSLKGQNTALPIFGKRLESPLGPAAGPHTQLSQNLVASYVAGGRFLELKTVQIIDGEDLSKCIGKPCINMEDEGYNCEWSTELTVQEAFEEYVKGYVACLMLSIELDLGATDGFIFNMSAGYDYKGITSEKVDRFLTEMADASKTAVWKECIDWCLANLHKFKNVTAQDVHAFSPQVTNNITLSTMHGCPPEEIERIATHLIEVKGLNTYVKCNPTLLGYQKVRTILDELGFDYVTFDDHHFNADLQFKDAVPMIQRLLDRAKAKGLAFGVKLTNTYPTQIANNELPGEEMYMSGRSLFPLSVGVAQLLAEAFGDTLPMSFSGGIEAHNARAMFDAGIWPLTVATVLLKPGGYAKMAQINGKLKDLGNEPFKGVNLELINAQVEDAKVNKAYIKKTPPKKNLPPSPITRDEAGNPIPQSQLPACLPGCDMCAQVCPNRSNMTVKGDGEKFATVCHLDGMCNECGNCATFCPTRKTPYRDKFTIYWTEEDFINSTNQGFLPLGDGKYRVRLLGQIFEDCTLTDPRLPVDTQKLMKALVTLKPFVMA